MKNIYLLFFTFLITSISFGQTPTLTILDGPPNGSTVTDDPETATNATIDFTTTNFVMCADASGTTPFGCEGYIEWSVVNINDAMNFDGGTIFTSNDSFEYTVNNLIAGQTYDFTSELVDINGDPLIPAVVYSFRIAIGSYIDVANLAALRAGMVNPNIYYQVTGQVINTNTIDEGSGRTMYFQDSFGGIKVYDLDYASSSYNTGDAVSNIRGHLEMVNGELHFVPTYAEWGTPDTTGNSPGIPTVTINTLMSNWALYESELVNINGVTFVDAGGTFIEATDYNINDGTGTTVFNTAFSNADYLLMGQNTIPTGSNNIVAVVTGTSVTARTSADFTPVLSIDEFDLNSLTLYPNPTSLGYVKISNETNSRMRISVFNIIGKQVIANQVIRNQRIDVSGLNPGIYIMKLSQDDATITKKLVIQ